MNSAADLVPWRFKAAVRRVLDAPARRNWRERRAGISKAEGSEPVVSFGGVLDDGRPVRGGAVKLLSLRRAFRCDEEKFNILYLVSSAQPVFAADLVAVCRRENIPVVWNQNGVGYPGWAGSEAERHNAPMRILRALADFVIYQSDFCRESAERFLGPGATASEVLFNPVDLGKFSPASQPLPNRPLRLLAMGTQNYAERVFSVLDCVRQLRADGIDCTLTVAGPLIWKDAGRELRERISSMGLTSAIEIRPAFRQDEAPSIYRSHHILVHPKYMDPCPTVVLEAMACGLPVIGSRSGGVPEMLDSSCAELVDTPLSWDRMHTPAGRQLADAVATIAGDLEKFSEASRRRAEQVFDARVWCDRHARIFREVLSTR